MTQTMLGNLVAVQAGIWISVFMILIVGCTVCFMMDMDVESKRNDTLLYAKFLTNVKEK